MWAWGVCSVPGFTDARLSQENNSPSPLTALLDWERKCRILLPPYHQPAKLRQRQTFPYKLWKVVWNGVCYLEHYLSVWDEVRSAGWKASCLALLPLCFLAHENQVGYERKRVRKFFSECGQTMSHTHHLWPSCFSSLLCCIIPDTLFFCLKWDWWCTLTMEFQGSCMVWNKGGWCSFYS